jgi:hypothetical protein
MKMTHPLKKTYQAVITTDGKKHTGQWKLELHGGLLGLAYLYETETLCVIPVAAVQMLVPNGSLTPSELEHIMSEPIHDEIAEECARG